MNPLKYLKDSMDMVFNSIIGKDKPIHKRKLSDKFCLHCDGEGTYYSISGNGVEERVFCTCDKGMELEEKWLKEN